MNAESYIRKHIQRILREQEEKEEKKSTIQSVGVGRGRLKVTVKEQGALAKEDPAQLMKNLNVTGVKKGKTEVETMGNLLEKAISGTDEMSEAFTKVKVDIVEEKNAGVRERVLVSSQIIPERDAHKYIEYTVLGATNAFGIKWSKNVYVGRSGSTIIIGFHSGSGKVPGWLTTESKDGDENLLGEPDMSKEDEREEDDETNKDEQSVSASVAGYTLPLGASNNPTTLKKRGEIAGQSFGGATPAKKKKKKKNSKKR